MALRVFRNSAGGCIVAIAAALGGCVSDGGPANSMARADIATISFESVDGPPPQVFDRLVSVLDSEAKLRGIPVASREGAATYRVRSYLSAQIRGPRTTIAWVWDVYDGTQGRALRLSGEETGNRRGADAWAAADDIVLRRIAQAGLSGLRGILDGQSLSPAPPRNGGPVVAENGAAAEASAVPVALGLTAAR